MCAYLSVQLDKSRVEKEFTSSLGVDDNNEELALTADSECISRGVPVYSPAFAGLLIAPTHGGMARLSWPGWLVKYQDGAGVIGARERHSSQYQSGLNETNGNQ